MLKTVKNNPGERTKKLSNFLNLHCKLVRFGESPSEVSFIFNFSFPANVLFLKVQNNLTFGMNLQITGTQCKIS